jgi:hypothetical protein
MLSNHDIGWQLYISRLKKAGRFLKSPNTIATRQYGSHRKKSSGKLTPVGNYDGSLLRRQPKAMAHTPANFPQAYQQQHKAQQVNVRHGSVS